MTTKTQAKPDIRPVVRFAADGLMHLHAHLTYIKAFDDELNGATRGKPAMIRNSIFWSIMLHSRDAFIIHLGSWAKHALDDSDGLFPAMRESCKVLLVKPLRKEFDPEVGDFGEIQSRIARRETFEKLFPAVVGRCPEKIGHADIKPIENEFRAMTNAVRDDRSANRAHPYETQERVAPMQDLVALDVTLSYCKKLISQLHLMVNRSSTNFPDSVIGDSPEQTAKVLVDHVLFHEPPDHTLYSVDHLAYRKLGLWSQQRRRAAYDILHAHFEKAQNRANKPKWFNSPVWSELVDYKAVVAEDDAADRERAAHKNLPSNDGDSGEGQDDTL